MTDALELSFAVQWKGRGKENDKRLDGKITLTMTRNQGLNSMDGYIIGTNPIEAEYRACI